MAYRQPTQSTSWKIRLGSWLQQVAYEAQFPLNDLRAVVERHRQTFPSSQMYRLLARVLWRDAIKYLLKVAIQDAAQQAGVQLAPGAADVIADVAVAFL